MLTDSEILNIVEAEERDAIGFQDELSEKRSTLIDYYNCELFGDEVDGRSKYVSSDVADVVEGMLPSQLRIFTQGKYVARFESDTLDGEDEAEQKTALANYVFMRQNQGTLILHNFIKDALLQYVGVVKVSWEESDKVTTERYQGLSPDEKAALESDEEVEIEEEFEDGCVVKRTKTRGKIRYDNVPPEEFIISRDARSFQNPRAIGFKTTKRRSQLVEMGFDKELVDKLPTVTGEDDEESYNRNKRLGTDGEGNPSKDKANDLVYLTELYQQIDIDEDGITELYQIFKGEGVILQKEPWDEHPFACMTPIPMPHMAIGNCPADQAADIQLVKSVLGRNMLDNIYNTNYPRIAYDEDKVDVDDLLTPRPGGAVSVEGPPGDALYPITIAPMSEPILQAIEWMDTVRETRTGVSRLNQGLDPETLNKTATGFTGLMDASMQRQELITRIFAETGIRDIFIKTVNILTRYQDEAMQIRITGRPMEVDPGSWSRELNCVVDVGLGSGDRGEKIANLNTILGIQMNAIAQGLTIADQSKIYNTLDKLVTEIGLKDAGQYFNNPELPDEIAQAMVEQMAKQVQMLQQQVQQNPLAEAEMIKAQARLVGEQNKAQIEGSKQDADMQKFIIKLAQEDSHFKQKYAKELAELELEYNADVNGDGQVGQMRMVYDPATGQLSATA